MTLDAVVDAGIKVLAAVGGPTVLAQIWRVWRKGRGEDDRAELDLAAAVRRIAAEEIAYARAESTAARLEAAAARTEVQAVRDVWGAFYRDLVARWDHHRVQAAPPPPPH